MKLLLQSTVPCWSVVPPVSYYNNTQKLASKSGSNIIKFRFDFYQYSTNKLKIIGVFNLHSSDYAIVKLIRVSQYLRVD